MILEKSVTATVGKRETLPCTTTLPDPVDWYYMPSENETARYICSAGHIVGNYSRRFTLTRDFQGDFSLVIQNVTLEDKGIYFCAEKIGLGLKHRIELTVDGKIIIEKCYKSISSIIQ